MSRGPQFSGTTPVRAEHRFDEARLIQWMEANVESYAGPDDEVSLHAAR